MHKDLLGNRHRGARMSLNTLNFGQQGFRCKKPVDILFLRSYNQVTEVEHTFDIRLGGIR